MTAVVFDTVVLSNFAASGTIDRLANWFEAPQTVPAVRSELRRGRDEGYQFTIRALDALDDEIPVVEPPVDIADTYGTFVDSGEASVLALAKSRGGIAATDDRAARQLAREREISVTGSVGILADAIERDRLDSETADRWLRTWQSATGYYSPVDSVDELL